MFQGMKWDNLRENKCPRPHCAKQLFAGAGGEIVCSRRECGFRISPKRMEEVVMKMNVEALKVPDVPTEML